VELRCWSCAADRAVGHQLVVAQRIISGNKLMEFRKLRIAWSVGWGIVAVLLIIWWAETYSWSDGLYWKYARAREFIIKAESGIIVLAAVVIQDAEAQPWPERVRFPKFPGAAVPSFAWRWDAEGRVLIFPVWLAVAVALGLGGAAWLPWRFSLRTLLIATTLVAVLLGAVIYAVR
jgi:hypothetical protein